MTKVIISIIRVLAFLLIPYTSFALYAALPYPIGINIPFNPEPLIVNLIFFACPLLFVLVVNPPLPASLPEGVSPQQLQKKRLIINLIAAAVLVVIGASVGFYAVRLSYAIFGAL